MSSAFRAEVRAIDAELAAEMQGKSWHDVPECPRFSELRLLVLSHYDFADQVQTGELVVASQVADEVCAILAELFAARFPIAGMQRIDAFNGSDDASMAANNCSAFNFRFVAGTRVLSQHALGLAIDINPVQNPWLHGERVDPEAGRDYLNRSDVRAGMIVRGGVVLSAFARHGWHWGGDFVDMADYHHFSKNPR